MPHGDGRGLVRMMPMSAASGVFPAGVGALRSTHSTSPTALVLSPLTLTKIAAVGSGPSIRKVIKGSWSGLCAGERVTVGFVQCRAGGFGAGLGLQLRDRIETARLPSSRCRRLRSRDCRSNGGQRILLPTTARLDAHRTDDWWTPRPFADRETGSFARRYRAVAIFLNLAMQPARLAAFFFAI